MTVTIEDIMTAASVIPVLVIDALADAAPLAHALKQGGLRVIELTMRTPVALDAMKAMQDAEPELTVGMGTIQTPEDAQASQAAGAAFLVSPGLTDRLGQALLETGLPCLPGVATAGEAMRAVEMGFTGLKFFPAEAAGGLAYLKSLAGPLPGIQFCPTGGISREKAADYLTLPSVPCVGGSWIATAQQIRGGDWAGITQNARAATALGETA